MKNITINKRLIRTSFAAPAVVAAALLLSSCSSSGGDSAGSSGSGGAEHSKQLAATECLRDKGYDVPDPEGNGDSMALSIPDGVDPAQFMKDSAACNEEAGIRSAAGGSEAKSMTAEHAPQIAECMRDKGYSDFPDDEDAIGEFQENASDPEAAGKELEQCTQQFVPGLGG